MIIATCILSYFVATLAFTLVYVCCEYKLSKDEWLAVIMLVICPLVWIALCYTVRAIKKIKQKKKIKKILQKEEE